MNSRRLRRRAAVVTSGVMLVGLGWGVSGAKADPTEPIEPGNARIQDRPNKVDKRVAKDGVGVSGTDLGLDQVGRSATMKHLANVKPSDPLADSTGTDIAFQDDRAYVGNYSGFSVWDISKPKNPTKISQVSCPGAQNDISVSGDLLYLSTDSSRSDDSCSSEPQSGTVKESWEGIKIFDISNANNPKYLKSVETACGSHTNTLVPGDKSTEFIYVSSYNPSSNLPDCQPPHDGISIIEVPKKNPAKAKVVATPVLFPDGGNESTNGCHDITAYPKRKIAAGACMGDGIIMDIRNPQKPKVIERVSDPNFSFWHSATFTNDGDKVVFTDELGGGGAATCDVETGPTHGANAIYGLSKQNQLRFQSYFKIDRHQNDSENCVSHNGSLIPVDGKDIMVQSWYMGGTSVWDFTDARRPREIGYFERGPAAGDDGGGTWSSYYYNGHIYSSDLGKGFDVLKFTHPLTNSAKSVKMGEFNPQSQPFVK